MPGQTKAGVRWTDTAFGFSRLPARNAMPIYAIVCIVHRYFLPACFHHADNLRSRGFSEDIEMKI
jgi:hypothetical protein